MKDLHSHSNPEEDLIIVYKKKLYTDLFKFVKEYPNNAELGSKLRRHIIKEYSNMYETVNPDQGTLEI